MFLRKGVNMKTLLEWLFTDNPTPQQIKNRIVLRRKWRKIKKALTPDEVIFPFLMGVLIIGLLASFLLYTGGVR